MKVVCLALLLVLTLQLQLQHASDNPLAQKNFVITANGPNQKGVNGVEVRFTNSLIFFNGCTENYSPYITIGNRIQFSEFSHERKQCSKNVDSLIARLFNESTNYDFSENFLTLKDRDGNARLILKEK